MAAKNGLEKNGTLSLGENIVVKKIDFNDPEVQKRLAYVLKAQKEALARKDIDRAKLTNTYITI